MSEQGQAINATYNFLLDIFAQVVHFLKSIPIGITVLDTEVSLFHFSIAVLLMGIVVTAVVNIVKTAPIDYASTQITRSRRRAEAEERYQRHRAERKR